MSITDKPRVRCSELHQLLWCPGSRLMQGKAKPPTEDTSQALAGRWCHARGAQRLRDEEGATGPAIAMPAFAASRFHYWIADFWLDTVRMYVESHMAIAYEQELEWEFDRFILTGHPDMYALDAEATEVVNGDLKAGLDPVTPADENAQILGYDVLFTLNYPTLRRATEFICQPLNNPDDGLDRVTVSRAETREVLETRVRYLEREINHALDNLYDLNSDGWKQCHYCRAAMICPAFEGDLEAMKMTLTPEQFAAIPSEPDIEKLYRFEEAAKKFQAPLALAHDTLKARVMEMGGAELSDGTKLFVVDRPGAREITDNVAATAALQDLPDTRFHECYKFKCSEIERQLAEHLNLPKTSKKERSGQTEFKDRLGAITHQSINRVLKIA